MQGILLDSVAKLFVLMTKALCVTVGIRSFLAVGRIVLTGFWQSRCFHLAGVVIFWLVTLLRAADPIPPQAIEVIRAGIEQWETDVEFVGNFESSSGKSSSIEKATAGDYDLTDGKLNQSSASGKIAKLGTLLRAQLHYLDGPKKAESPFGLPMKGAEYFRNIDFDEVTNGQLQIRYDPKEGDLGDDAVVALRREMLVKSLAAGLMSEGLRTPLTPTGLRLSELFDAIPHGGSWANTKLTNIDQDYVEIQLDTAERNAQINRRIRIWISASPPVITEIEDSTYFKKEPIDWELIKLSKFIECPGGKVAREIRRIHSGGKPPYTTDLWYSTDLGQRIPSKNDFVIEIPATTIIGGLRNPPPPGKLRSLDITSMQLSDLLGSKDLPASTSGAASASSNAFRLLLLIGNAVLVLFIACWIIYRRYRAGASLHG